MKRNVVMFEMLLERGGKWARSKCKKKIKVNTDISATQTPTEF